MPVHADTGSRAGRPAAAFIRSRRNVPHSISPLYGTLGQSRLRALRSGTVALGQMRLRKQPGTLAHLARAMAVSLIVVWVAVAVGCGASEEAPSNPPSPRVAQPSEDVTPAPTREAARSSASAVEAQTTALPRETPTPPAATPSPESPTAAPAPAPSPTSTAAPVKTEPPVPPKEAPPDGTEGRSSLARGPGGAEDSDSPPKGNPPPDPRVEAIARSLVSGGGPVFTWRDGEHTRQVRLVTGLVAQPGADSTEDDVVVTRAGDSSIVLRQARHSSNAAPVFVSASGGLMTLPGGVLLALDPEWSGDAIGGFFSANGIKRSFVSERFFAANAFFVETAPGMPSLELANALASQEGVVISSPNWAQEAVLR